MLLGKMRHSQADAESKLLKLVAAEAGPVGKKVR